MTQFLSQISFRMKIILLVGVVLIGGTLAGRSFFEKWFEIQLKRVEMGLAKETFPYRDFSQEELEKMFPQTIEPNADVPTRVTPEETYAKFRQALKENNLQMAIEQLYSETGVEIYDNFWKKNNVVKTKAMENFAMGYGGGAENKRYEENVNDLTKAYKEGKFGEAYKASSEKIRKETMDNYRAVYEYDYIENGIALTSSIDFKKNINGDWKMDSL